MRQPDPCVRALCEPVALLLSKNMTYARPRCNATPSEHCALTPCTSHFTLHLISPHLSSSHLVSPYLSSSHLIPSLLTFRPSKFFSTLIRALINLSHLLEVLLNQREASCTKNIARRKPFHTEAWDSIYTERPLRKYFVLQSLHKALLGTTMYYKACTKHFPVLLCTTKLASTSLHYKACTNYFPLLLCTTKLAQSTSQYYFVLHSLHKCTSQYFFVLQN